MCAATSPRSPRRTASLLYSSGSTPESAISTVEATLKPTLRVLSDDKGKGLPERRRQAIARSSSDKGKRYSARIASFSRRLVVAATASAVWAKEVKRET